MASSFLSKLIANKLAGKNRVAFNHSDKLHYFLSRIMGAMPKLAMAKMASKAFVGIPLMAYANEDGLQLIKTASLDNEDIGRRWIIDTLTDNGNGGFKKEASSDLLVGSISPETVDLIHRDGDLLNVITLAKLAKLI
jgi:hypothetical protein